MDAQNTREVWPGQAENLWFVLLLIDADADANAEAANVLQSEEGAREGPRWRAGLRVLREMMFFVEALQQRQQRRLREGVQSLSLHVLNVDPLGSRDEILEGLSRLGTTPIVVTSPGLEVAAQRQVQAQAQTQNEIVERLARIEEGMGRAERRADERAERMRTSCYKY
ncbi:hypothetical protein KEM56_001429, partial [Ascosphaera pollenicola]